ncbi:unnamed protein product [Dovyalis caffra]|uniref:Protein kinase domain-containing protein n=1 Tax=Dovyalis caffra TaxID=77055 RepID=A0AAV1RG17_9ROSI|nr:unnamed protein product [Dovyalis caffra]
MKGKGPKEMPLNSRQCRSPMPERGILILEAFNNLSDSMTTEAPTPSFQWIVNTAGEKAHNESIQISEEFSMEFLQDRVATRGILPMPSTVQVSEKRVGHDNDQNHQIRYQDIAHILGLRRMDSECASDVSDFASAKGSLNETENGAYVDKLSRCNTEDVDTEQRSRKAFAELNCDWGGGLVQTALPSCALESSHSSNFNGPNVLGRSPSGKMKLLCSFGGKILPRPSDGKLRYVGGETRIVSISKNLSWEELVKKTSGICDQPHSIKYQLPGEDLDALISVSSNEDLQNMIEEYHGLERLKGSQRLRMFLIPFGESERSSSFEETAIQQTNPDYHYVVAVNGILDPSPRKNFGRQGMESEASQPVISWDHGLSFHKQVPCSLLPLETKGFSNAFHPTQFSNESQNIIRSPHISPPISPIPLQHGDSRTAHEQLHGNSSSIESSSSLVTAQLPLVSCSTDTAGYKQPMERPVILMSNHQLSKQVDVGQPDQHHNHNLSKELVSPAVIYPNDDNFDGPSFKRPVLSERAFLSEKPIASTNDPLGMSSGSIDSVDSHHGMPHAFSDSKLQELGGMSACCSQEGMSPLSPLNFAKTQSSSMLISSASQAKPIQLQGNTNFANPQVESKLLDIEPTGSQSRTDFLNFSPYSETTGRNQTIQNAATNMEDKCHIPNHCEETSWALETTNRIDTGDQFSYQFEKPHEEKSPVARIEYRNKLPNVNCNTIFSDIDNPAQRVQVYADRVPASSAIGFNPFIKNLMELSQINQLEKTSSDIPAMDQRIANNQYCTLSGKMNGDQGSGIPWTRNPEGSELFQNATQHPGNKNFQVDLIPGSLNGPIVLELAQVQPLETQIGISNKEAMLMSFPKNYPSAVFGEAASNANLHENNLHAADCDTTNDTANEMHVFLLDDDHGAYPEKIENVDFTGSAYRNSDVMDIMLAQPKIQIKSKSTDQNQPEPLVIVEDGTDNVAQSIQSSLEVVAHVSDPTGHNGISMVIESEKILPHVADSNSSDFISLAVKELDEVIACVRPDIADPTCSKFTSPTSPELDSVASESDFENIQADDGDRDESISDSMIAEMEASIYGLQIIKNADLEELRELGSGTYGTVYHGKWRGTDVAIKRIKKSCFAGRSSEQERLTKDFWREAQILSNLHHPNVVAFYGVVPDGIGGTLATITEFMVNGSLRHVLLKKDRSLDCRKKLIIAMDAAFGMEYLHSKNIVHFDLKCDNLLVNLRDPQRPICKVGDFGLSRIKRNTLVSGGVRGTLPWMAPELLNGSSNQVSEKVDVYSFGISLWEILTGEEPYADMHCGAIIGGIVKNTLRPPIPELCEPEWRKLMEHCWSPDPESRPSFSEITNRLRAMSMALSTRHR